MICKQCHKSFPHRTGSYCGGCQKPYPEFKGLSPHEIAERTFNEAERLGLEVPTQAMVAAAINTAVSEVLLWVDGQKTGWHDAYYDQSIHNTRWQQEGEVEP